MWLVFIWIETTEIQFNSLISIPDRTWQISTEWILSHSFSNSQIYNVERT